MKKSSGKRAFYTGSGDGGRTGLLGKQKVSKGSHRIDVIGELDELSAALGLARSAAGQDLTRKILIAVQRDAYVLMAALAVAGKLEKDTTGLAPERVSWLEEQIDILVERTKLPQGFILPGDTPGGAALDFARAIARRVERRIVRQADRGRKVDPAILSYLNRLSSLLFVLELYELETQSIKPTLAKV
jgi:cob(I)alamin adenosyltransferase